MAPPPSSGPQWPPLLSEGIELALRCPARTSNPCFRSSSQACLPRLFIRNFHCSLGGKGKQSHCVTLVLAKMLIEGLNSIKTTPLPIIKDQGADTCLREQRLAWHKGSCACDPPYRWMDTVRKLGFQPGFTHVGCMTLGKSLNLSESHFLISKRKKKYHY